MLEWTIFIDIYLQKDKIFDLMTIWPLYQELQKDPSYIQTSIAFVL